MSADEHRRARSLLAHFHRDPLPGAGVRIILVTEHARGDGRKPIIAPDRCRG